MEEMTSELWFDGGIPNNNLLESAADDYGSAKVRLVWNFCSGSNKASLVFATIELLPKEFPFDAHFPLASGELQRIRVSGSSKNFICVHECQISLDEALLFHKGLRDNAGYTFDIPFVNVSKDSKLCLQVPEFAEEPSWPRFVLVGHNEPSLNRVLPFLQYWHRQPRISHLIATSGQMDWPENEQKKAWEILSDLLGFRWADYPVLSGSVHLIALDPVFRECNMRLMNQEDGLTGEGARFSFVRRVGKASEEASVVVIERRPTGFGRLWVSAIALDDVIIDFEGDVDSFDYWVVCPRRGVLSTGKKVSFIRSIHMNVGLMGRKHVFKDGKGEILTERTVVGSTEKVVVGRGDSLPPARALLANAIRTAEKRNDEFKYGQKWFMDDKPEGVRFIRDLFNSAHNRLWIVDPYFSAVDYVHLLSISNIRMPILVVTSAASLSQKGKASPDGGDIHNASAATEMTRGSALACAARAMAEKLGSETNPLEVRVMGGRSSPIHDRFIVVDDDVWHFGSSLNNFGAHGVLVMKVPHPQAVLKELEPIISDSETVELSKWVDSRCSSATDDAGPSGESPTD